MFWKRVCVCSSMNVHTCARSCVCVCVVTRGNLKPCHKAAFAIFLLTHRYFLQQWPSCFTPFYLIISLHIGLGGGAGAKSGLLIFPFRNGWWFRGSAKACGFEGVWGVRGEGGSSDTIAQELLIAIVYKRATERHGRDKKSGGLLTIERGESGYPKTHGPQSWDPLRNTSAGCLLMPLTN